MAQIVTQELWSNRCNLRAIQNGGSLASDILGYREIWLVDTTNANKGEFGFGVYDSYIIGDGETPASQLEVFSLDLEPKSAYDIAVEEGFNGTVQQWLESLKGQNGVDGAVLDGVNIYDSLDLVLGKTEQEKHSYIPNANVLDSVSNEIVVLDTDVNGGISEQTVSGKSLTSRGTAYFSEKDGHSNWYYSHGSVYSYAIKVTPNMWEISGSSKFVRNDLLPVWMLIFSKSTPWQTVPQGFTNLGEVVDAKTLTKSFEYCIALNSMKYNRGDNTIKEFDLEIPEGTNTIYICSYGNNVKLNIKTIDEKPSLISQIESNTEELSKLGYTQQPKDLNCLLLRNYIKTLWNYYFNYDGDYRYLDKKLNEIPEGKHFISIADVHWKDNPSKKINYIASYIANRLGGCTTVFLGDAVNHASTKLDGCRELAEYSSEFYSAFGDNSLWICGNHDANYAAVNPKGQNPVPASVGLMDDRDIYNLTVKPIAHKVVFDEVSIDKLQDLQDLTEELKELGEAWIKLHYHWDDHTNKIRYIVLETGNGGQALRTLTGRATNYILPMLFVWFARVLNSTPDDFDIVVLGHSFTLNSNDSDARNLFKILYKFKLKQSVGINMRRQNTTNGTSFARAMCGISANRTFNFTKSTHNGRAIVVGGHYHRDRIYQFLYNNSAWQLIRLYPTLDTEPYLKNAGFLYVITNTDNYTRTGDTPDMTNEDRPQTLETVTEVSFDVITITDNNQLVCTKIGWGESHQAEIPMFEAEEEDLDDPTVTYEANIESNLTDLSILGTDLYNILVDSGHPLAQNINIQIILDNANVWTISGNTGDTQLQLTALQTVEPMVTTTSTGTEIWTLHSVNNTDLSQLLIDNTQI